MRHRIERASTRFGAVFASLGTFAHIVWHSALVTIQATHFQRVVSVPVDLPRIVLGSPTEDRTQNGGLSVHGYNQFNYRTIGGSFPRSCTLVPSRSSYRKDNLLPTYSPVSYLRIDTGKDALAEGGRIELPRHFCSSVFKTASVANLRIGPPCSLAEDCGPDPQAA